MESSLRSCDLSSRRTARVYLHFSCVIVVVVVGFTFSLLLAFKLSHANYMAFDLLL